MYIIDVNEVKLMFLEFGDDKNDGIFYFVMNNNDMSVIYGEWIFKLGEVKKVWIKCINEEENGFGEEFGKWLILIFLDFVVIFVFE